MSRRKTLSVEQLAQRALELTAKRAGVDADPDAPLSGLPLPKPASLKGIKGIAVLGEERLSIMRAVFVEFELAFWNAVLTDALAGGRNSRHARDLFTWLLYKRERASIDVRTVIFNATGAEPEQAKRSVEIVEEVEAMSDLEVARLNVRFLAAFLRRNPERRDELLGMLT